MTVAIVEAFEVVDVDERDAKIATRVVIAADESIQGVVEPAAVVDAGQAVEQSGAFITAALTDIRRDGDVVGSDALHQLEEQVHSEGVRLVDHLPEGLFVD